MDSNLAVRRLAYDLAKKMIENQDQNMVVNQPPTNGRTRVTMAQSYIRTEMPLNQNLTNYNFAILDNKITSPTGVIAPTEQRLALQDAFFAYNLGVYLVVDETASGNTQYQNQLLTFPNPQFFGSGTTDLNLQQGIWNNGTLALTINSQVITPAWDLAKHLYIPQTQINTVTWPDGDFFNQYDGEGYGKCSIEPNWVFNGAANIDLQVNFRKPLNQMGIGTDFETRLVLIFQGYLAQNCSSIMREIPVMK